MHNDSSIPPSLERYEPFTAEFTESPIVQIAEQTIYNTYMGIHSRERVADLAKDLGHYAFVGVRAVGRFAMAGVIGMAPIYGIIPPKNSQG